MSVGGRKVFRSSSNSRKKKAKKAVIVFFSILVLALLIFIIYSITVPILNYINNREPIQTEPWTPPLSESTVVSTEPVINSEENETENTDKTQVENNEFDFTACELPIDALVSEKALTEYVNEAKANGYSAVKITMKAKGGLIYYATNSEFAKTGIGTISGTLTADKIASIIKENGVQAFASLNLLEDNNRYGENRDGSYHIKDGSTWLDNSVAKGGKPWLSPFEEKTIEYIAYLSDELSKAGFDVVIAEGVVFPNFRNSDIGYIGDKVAPDNRYTALIGALNSSRDAVEINNVMFALELNAADVVNDKSEIFKPDELQDITIIAEYIPSSFNNTIVYNGQEIVLSELTAGEKFRSVFTVIKEKSNTDMNIIPLIKYNDFNQADFNEVISELLNEGYDSYIVE